MTDWRAGAVAALASLAWPLTSAAQTLGYTVGVAGVTGRYPGERVDSAYVFHTLDVAGGPIRMSVTVPWFRLESTPDGGVPGSVSGLGDPLVRADVRVAERRSAGWQLSAAGAVKPPMVDVDSGRGTGELDLGAGGNLLTVRGRVSLLADAMYWHYGDPEGVELPDVLAYSVGLARSLGTGRWSAMGTISGVSDGPGDLSPPVSATVAALRLIGRRRSLVLSVSVGLTEGASDFSAGLSWRTSR